MFSKASVQNTLPFILAEKRRGRLLARAERRLKEQVLVNAVTAQVKY